MPFRVRRLAAPFLLALFVASPASSPEAAVASDPPTRPAIGSGGATGALAAATPRRRARRARRVPPSGCYARNAIVLDPATGEVLYEKMADASVPIASLSKLMTTLVFLEQQPDLAREVMVTRDELGGGGHTQLVRGERVALGDLLHMSLMSSDNVATRVLMRESGLPEEDFLAHMNRKALELGLASTRFVECTGLDERNVSTASDVAKMLQAAAKNDKIQTITTTRSYAFRSASRRYHRIGNTNRMLYGRYEILGGKTGFISEAGYCIATWVHTQGRDLIAVVLGAPTNATRFADVVRLLRRTTTTSFAQIQLGP
ncbi:MAG: hypothetical protein A2W00_08625 [Candidatus Eisenbacteria bacterium RBG_16_71_46]|nr:MAG: hypothetical protein A2W00_08625 [Candidatus Eisenbacteria bacterium RBG_16_71_46]OGF21119.1 MAG: hypothetical protein A2V63_07200 [Candidatus Eisenbacteria bacterium RBG_19FT_COMBO_70_11]